MLIDFFTKNLDIVFFIYGLAFFVMGTAIFIQPKKESGFKLAQILWLLAAFGFVHGVNEFLDMWAIIKGRSFAFNFLHLSILVVSYLFLFEFGRRLFCSVKPPRLQFSILFAWWLAPLILPIVLISVFFSAGAWQNGVIIARYLLGFPGGLLTSVGFFLYYKYNKEKLSTLKVKKYFYGSTLAFLVYGILGGLVVPKGNFFPANWLNAESFLLVAKIPVQILRAVCAIIAAWGACGILRIFDWEKKERLKKEISEHHRTRLISEGLRAVVEISDELISCSDEDMLFKISIGFARAKLGIERCAIFTEDYGYMIGTYGTDRYGRTTDEHAQRFPKGETWDKHSRLIGHQGAPWFMVDEPYPEWDGKSTTQTGKGWIVITPIQSARRAIGVFVNGAAIGSAGLDHVKQDILAVFCSLLGNIAERKRTERERELLDKKLIKLNKKLEKLAVRDSHTGLYNHRYLMNIIEAEFERAIRHNNPLSVFMMDLDYFKSINDVYGHQFGDLVLKQLARQLKRAVRRYDIVIRFGGEEFMIISPGTDNMRALILAKRILKTVNEYDFGNKERTVKLKLTIAVSSYPEDKATKGMDLIGRTDQILNKAKEDGGNRAYSSLDLEKTGALSMQDEIATNKVKYLKDKIDKLTRRADQSLIEAVFAFAKTTELKDHPTADHVQSSAHYATEIAKALNLSGEDTERIRQAYILHDLGKVGISEHILIKKLKLTPAEFEEIRKHPQIGVDIIRPIYFLRNIVPFILYHHERWDGRGYPSGLSDERIPLGARIVAIADVYQALTSERPYRKAYSKEEAMKIIREASGMQFDPKIVKLFLKILEREEDKEIMPKRME